MKTVYNFGINDSETPVHKREWRDGKYRVVWQCPIYVCWKSMIQRCYSEKYHKTHPTYKGVVVCEEWRLFSNFKKWASSQEYEGLCLDKDILSGKSKVYSPETCCFIPNSLNMLLLVKSKSRGLYPLGVSFKKKFSDMNSDLSNPYYSYISSGKSVNKCLGCFSTVQEAHRAWQLAKIKRIEESIEDYSKLSCFREDVAEALRKRIHIIKSDYDNFRETTQL